MDPKTLFYQSLAAHQAGDFAVAESGYQQLLTAAPGHPQVSYLFGALRGQQGRHDEALTLLDRAQTVMPQNPAILLHQGNALQGLGRFDESLAKYDAALALKPDYDEALNNRGNTLRAAGRFEDAVSSFDAALVLKPGDFLSWYNRGIALHDLRRYDDALASYDRSLLIRPDFAEAHSNKGATLQAMGQHERSLGCFERALALQPDNPDFKMSIASALRELKRFDQAQMLFEVVLTSGAPVPRVFGEVCKTALYGCNWSRMAELKTEISARIEAGSTDVQCWVLMSYDPAPELMALASRNSVQEVVGSEVYAPLWTGKPYDHDRIRVAYLSSDFREHPVGYQIAELLERHDRSRFEVIGISGGGNAEETPIRQRLTAAFDQFHNVEFQSVESIADLLRQLEVDLAVDLSGHTSGNMFASFARRPAPVQVTWLGYAGTTGCDQTDYILGDAVALPYTLQPFYSEKIVHLPDNFFPLDTTKTIQAPPTRTEMGLPDAGFVFCCFNTNWKITAEVFDVWMRLLYQVPGSVLWLRRGNEAVLRREAQARGIDPVRLIFANHVPLEVHMARHQLADLFLDTLPYNAHTTAVDALQAGLPVLTRLGDAFPGRIAASHLTAAGLPELVTTSVAEYEALALALARDPARLLAIRDKLRANQKTAPLFDMARFTRNIEAAYEAMLKEKTGA